MGEQKWAARGHLLWNAISACWRALCLAHPASLHQKHEEAEGTEHEKLNHSTGHTHLVGCVNVGICSVFVVLGQSWLIRTPACDGSDGSSLILTIIGWATVRVTSVGRQKKRPGFVMAAHYTELKENYMRFVFQLFPCRFEGCWIKRNIALKIAAL